MVIGQVLGDGREPHTVEAHGTRPRGHPQVAVARLEDTGERVVRQPFGDAPMIDDVAALRRNSGGHREQHRERQGETGSHDPDSTRRRADSHGRHGLPVAGA